jgi:glycosyltransferase involved in cell wall biosynthesis
MQMGCPVISSVGGSLPEVGGKGLKYFNPYSAEDISIAIEEVLSSKKKIDNLIKYGFKRAEYFSWSKCARETLEAYKKIL